MAVQGDLLESRIETLRRVTDLFLNDADRLSDDQIKVFDDVLCLLIRRIEGRALVELSKRLAPIDKSPIDVIRQLANHEDIEIAGPVLAESRRLSTGDLIDIAATKSQAHLLAISGRYALEASLTDVLLSRGNEEVVFKLATNSGARFSQTGYEILVRDAEGDDKLAETVGLRFDIPPRFLQELLERATEAVRARILSLSPPETREEVQRVITDIARSVGHAAVAERDFADAERLVLAMEKSGKLDEGALLEFVAAAALRGDDGGAGAAVRRVVENGLRIDDGAAQRCAAGSLQGGGPEMGDDRSHPAQPAFQSQDTRTRSSRIAHGDYDRLSVATARRTLRFMQVRDAAK